MYRQQNNSGGSPDATAQPEDDGLRELVNDPCRVPRGNVTWAEA